MILQVGYGWMNLILVMSWCSGKFDDPSFGDNFSQQTAQMKLAILFIQLLFQQPVLQWFQLTCDTRNYVCFNEFLAQSNVPVQLRYVAPFFKSFQIHCVLSHILASLRL